MTLDRSPQSPAALLPPPPPEHILCSITLDLMQEPVVDSLGHTYERRAIETWLARNPNFCPATHEPYTPGLGASLRPNWAVKKATSEYLLSIGQTAEAYFKGTAEVVPEYPTNHIRKKYEDLQHKHKTEKVAGGEIPKLSYNNAGQSARSSVSVAPLPFDGPIPPLPTNLIDEEVELLEIHPQEGVLRSRKTAANIGWCVHGET